MIMWSANTFMIACAVLLELASAATASHRAPVLSTSKRATVTCEQTYGQGWIQCGDASSTFCYNPSLGQSCCPADSGYCDKGTFCAPVAGFCCVSGQDVATCAKNAGFALPSSLSSAALAPTASSAASVTLTLGIPDSIAATSAASFTGFDASYPTAVPAGNASSSSNSTTGSPVVQVSLAMKERRALPCMTLAVAVIGLFLGFC